MAVFLTPLVLHPLPERRWQVMADFRIHLRSAMVLTVPEGFVTDLNSLPRVWWSVSPASDYPEAGVAHDYLYATQANKAGADSVYLELLEALGMSRPRRLARYWALVLFGGPAYASHRPGG